MSNRPAVSAHRPCLQKLDADACEVSKIDIRLRKNCLYSHYI